jgi:hypothetical protein
MIPAEVTPLEERQFSLVVRRSGADPASFEVRKFRKDAGFKVRVVGLGAASVYDMEDANSWIGKFSDDVDRGVFGAAASGELPAPLAQALSDVEKALAQGGLSAALTVLNRRVPHRFTAVYRRVGQSLHNVGTADKHLHLDPLDLKVVPLNDSFCQFVLRDGLFLTQDSGTDERLQGHPYSGIVGCYVGVRVQDREGSLAGTLCHFDVQSHEVDDSEYLLLDRAARLMPAFLRG